MKWLDVTSKYSCLCCECRWVIQCPNFYNHRVWACRALGSHRRSAIFAKMSSDRRLKIGSCKLFWISLYVAKCIFRKHHNNVWVTASDVLAFSAVTLECSFGLPTNFILKVATIATSCGFHHRFSKIIFVRNPDRKKSRRIGQIIRSR